MKRFNACSAVSRLWLALGANPSRWKVRDSRLIERGFATTPGLRLRTSELSVSQLQDLKVNADRLWNDIHHTAQWGIGKRYGDSRESTGMSRLALSDADKRARDWFVETTKSLSCNIHVDQIGNIFAIRPGLDNSKPATFAGSHLDTQPTGGRFDGILGVCAGIEMLRVLEENWVETEGPVGVVNWTNEEGARFPLSMMGSGVWCGQIPLDKAHNTLEVGDSQDGRKSVKEELDRIGYLGKTECSWQSGIQMGGHFELHIEQGPHLVSANQKLGAVEGAQAYQWFTIRIEGRDCHSGTTSLNHRADALYNAAQLIIAVRKIARRFGGLATVGIIKAEPGSVNTVPGLVTMSLDMRHHRDDQLYRMVDRLHQKSAELAAFLSRGAYPLRIQIETDFHSKAVKFQPAAVDCVETAARSLLENSVDQKNLLRRMVSGAGHDSVFASRRCPTAMVFVPCKDGVSHHPEEWCEKEGCANGASVLIGAVLRFDQKRHKLGEFV